MSSYLWKFYLEDDVDTFQRLLVEAAYVTGPHAPKGQLGSVSNAGSLASSLGGGSASRPARARRPSKQHPTAKLKIAGSSCGPWASLTLTRLDVNLRDRTGLTILHHAASSTAPSAMGFATALIDHPLCDIYLQDEENGWTAMHRALYFGNVTIARAILERDMRQVSDYVRIGPALHAGGIIRVKDHEGNSPFDVFNATVAPRPLRHRSIIDHAIVTDDNDEDEESSSDADDDDKDHTSGNDGPLAASLNRQGDEVFMFGSNKNFNLGFGDEDDRQYPERVTLNRPDRLFHRFYRDYRRGLWPGGDGHGPSQSLATDGLPPSRRTALPASVRYRKLVIRDLAISKYHTALLTTDPEANLYVCGYGPGGRLGTGDETTRFTFTCVEEGGLADKRIVNVALGHNHTLATTSEGEVFSWGSNVHGQLGYALPKPNSSDEDPIQTTPRQIFGPLKREVVLSTAASRIHSVVHTATALYTFGKNEGQLGLVDSDARSLEVQTTPRRVGVSLFSAPIRMVSALDSATICLLSSNEIWVLANFGYARLAIPGAGFTSHNYFLRKSGARRYGDTSIPVSKICSGADTICVLSDVGDVFAVRLSQKLEPGPMDASTTNPTKIRNALTPPHRIWSFQKGHMAGKDIGVGQDGSIIICTKSGSVWRRVKRAKIEDGRGQSSGKSISKDYKFSRVPGLTRITAVRSNTSGVYAAIRTDLDVTRTQVTIDDSTLAVDLRKLLPFKDLHNRTHNCCDSRSNKFWRSASLRACLDEMTLTALVSSGHDVDVATVIIETPMSKSGPSFDIDVCTSRSSAKIPAHRLILRGRCPVLARLLSQPYDDGGSSVSDLLSITSTGLTTAKINFHGLDFLTIYNLVLYLYADRVVEFWQWAREIPTQAGRFRHTRVELCKIASRLELRELEQALKSIRQPKPSLHHDIGRAMSMADYFDDGDILIQLRDAEVRVHSLFMCLRCPFFRGLFSGRAAGMWLSARRQGHSGQVETTTVDLSHVDLDIFNMVLHYVYADDGEEMFDALVTDDLDDFLDVVIEVMSVANELMLERLCQICQKVLGRFGKRYWL